MTTRINGRSFWNHVRPSIGQPPSLNTGNRQRIDDWDEQLFRHMDEYLATQPGTHKALSLVRVCRPIKEKSNGNQ